MTSERSVHLSHPLSRCYLPRMPSKEEPIANAAQHCTTCLRACLTLLMRRSHSHIRSMFQSHVIKHEGRRCRLGNNGKMVCVAWALRCAGMVGGGGEDKPAAVRAWSAAVALATWGGGGGGVGQGQTSCSEGMVCGRGIGNFQSPQQLLQSAGRHAILPPVDTLHPLLVLGIQPVLHKPVILPALPTCGTTTSSDQVLCWQFGIHSILRVS